MKFLAIEKDIAKINSTDYKDILTAETKQVWDLQQKNIIREIYFTENKNAVIIMECNSKNEAKTILDAMPLAKNKLVEFEIKQLNPYSGYERLFY